MISERQKSLWAVLPFKNPNISLEWLNYYGSKKIIIGADVRNGKISTSGWLHDSNIEIMDFLSEYLKNGAQQVISTDISVDGTLNGPSTSYTKI